MAVVALVAWAGIVNATSRDAESATASASAAPSPTTSIAAASSTPVAQPAATATATPTPSPSPVATPSPAPSATPAPTATPINVADDQPQFITSGDRARFEGTAGTYTWSSLDFADSQVTVRWSVSASSKGDCRVGWRLVPIGDDPFSSIIHVDAGDSETGNRKHGTPFAKAALVVRSTCGAWKVSMQGYEPPPPPTPRPVADGGGGGSCHPSYRGACLKQNAGDYDCASGSGNGPNYVGTVRVVGYDEFDLDRDGDGIGCENG